MRRAIETVPKDGEVVILEDDANGNELAHWSAEAGAWVGENGGPSKITPTYWHEMRRDKYLPLEPSLIDPAHSEVVISEQKGVLVNKPRHPSRSEGAATMSDYSAYIIGTPGHRFIKADQFLSVYPDDATAIRAAEQLVDGYDVELWDRTRLVARIDHKSRASAICDDETKAWGSDTDLANLKVVAGGPVKKAADLKSKVDVSTAPDPPRDGSAIIIEDDASATYNVAHSSPEAGEWVGENGEPTKITPSHWSPMPRDKHLSLESDGSSNPSQARPSPARARRYATSSIAAALVSTALIGTYFRDDVAAFVMRYAGQQDIFRGSTIGEQVVVRGTQLQSQDSQKTNTLALRQQPEADQAGAQEAAQVKQAVETSVPDPQQSLEKEKRAEALANELAEARRTIDGLNLQLRTEAATTAQLLGQEREKTAALVEEVTAARQELAASTGQHGRALEEERARSVALASELAMARREIETNVALLKKAGDDAAREKRTAVALQQERDRAEASSRELAIARREIETNATLLKKVRDDAAQFKQTGEKTTAALRQERDKAEASSRELAIARREIEANAALLKKAGDDAAREKRTAVALQQERDRVEASSSREPAIARREIEANAALLKKAGDDAAQFKQSGEKTTAAQQQKRDSAKALSREPVMARELAQRVIDTRTTLERTANSQIAEVTQAAEASDSKQPVAEVAKGDAEVAKLIVRARALLGQGNIAAARTVLERAAETGSAQASFTLAETYDPIILSTWGTYGTHGDAAKARELYAKAHAGGIQEAKNRFDALNR
jgi:hypothetical protein